MNKKLILDELNRIEPEEYAQQADFSIAVVLDNIRSLSNIGSIFRTCDGFGIGILYLCGITATPPHREITKTALGATETVQWQHNGSTIEVVQNLQANGFVVVAVEQVENKVWLQGWTQNLQPDSKVAIVLGNEVEGVQEEVIAACDYCVEIPQFGSKHSFNVATTAGIVLWELKRSKI